MAFVTVLFYFFLALNYDFESSQFSSQSAGKDVHNTGLVKKEVTIAKGDSASSFDSSTTTVTKSTKTTIITSENKIAAIEGRMQVMDMSAGKLEEDVFE